MTVYLMTAWLFLRQMGRDGHELASSLRASLTSRLEDWIAKAFEGVVLGVFWVLYMAVVGALGAAWLYGVVRFIKWAWAN